MNARPRTCFKLQKRFAIIISRETVSEPFVTFQTSMSKGYMFPLVTLVGEIVCVWCLPMAFVTQFRSRVVESPIIHYSKNQCKSIQGNSLYVLFHPHTAYEADLGQAAGILATEFNPAMCITTALGHAHQQLLTQYFSQWCV